MGTITEQAPAKINLTLDILNRRPDGYHNLSSVMQSVTLYDVVMLTSGTGAGITVETNRSDLPGDETNLAHKAAQVFFQKTGITCDGLSIRLQKNIPMGAGLGGGSSDAAAVLRGLRKLYDPEMPISRLQRMAIAIGSDVPFCVRGDTALVRGKGEEMIRLPRLPLCFFVICKPDFSLSTAEMYQKIDENKAGRLSDAPGLMKALEYQDMREISERLFNGFEQILPPESEIFRIKEKLLSLQARGAAMTGSGSAVYGLYTEETAAKTAYEALKKTYSQTFLTQSV
ncbi:MAG: 4-(cytidine 5'-diphospho)-2-C-methyl-D-erythritol kinase [Clostridiales bacterium]|nr:4-(cytidine 5'-diphospho)-2-C-methyl-D-erythritol kinase [Clostridiales bacterium]